MLCNFCSHILTLIQHLTDIILTLNRHKTVIYPSYDGLVTFNKAARRSDTWLLHIFKRKVVPKFSREFEQ